jgi:hypothetical protein
MIECTYRPHPKGGGESKRQTKTEINREKKNVTDIKCIDQTVQKRQKMMHYKLILMNKRETPCDLGQKKM